MDEKLRDFCYSGRSSAKGLERLNDGELSGKKIELMGALDTNGEVLKKHRDDAPVIVVCQILKDMKAVSSCCKRIIVEQERRKGHII